jgi:hypothetical protein
MANVETPQTFMTAYQQGRQNRRQDKVDDQKLAFTIFDEDRRRAKHKAQMDRAMEDTRHLKTMNPFLESIDRYRATKSWSTLESDVIKNKDATKHQVLMNVTKERKAQSELDNAVWRYAQNPEAYGVSHRFGKEATESQKKKRSYLDQTVEGALGNQLTTQRIQEDFLSGDERESQAIEAADEGYHDINAYVNERGEMYDQEGDFWAPAKRGGALGQKRHQLDRIQPLTYQSENYKDLETERGITRVGYKHKREIAKMDENQRARLRYIQSEGDRLHRLLRTTTGEDERDDIMRRIYFNTTLSNRISNPGGVNQGPSPMDRLMQNMKED